MKRIIVIVIAMILAFVVGGGVMFGFMNWSTSGNTRTTNDKAEKDEKSRYITIINDTKKTINEVHIYVGVGTEIEKAYQKNPDEKSFSIEIPQEYDEYEEFKVSLVDNYERVYEKTVKKVKKTGRTEVTINENDYIQQEGDWKSKVFEFFNH